jgi:hypothetical protein
MPGEHHSMSDSIENHMAKRVETYDACAMIDSWKGSALSASTNR